MKFRKDEYASKDSQIFFLTLFIEEFHQKGQESFDASHGRFIVAFLMAFLSKALMPRNSRRLISAIEFTVLCGSKRT
jgi:hypothetical protein